MKLSLTLSALAICLSLTSAQAEEPFELGLLDSSTTTGGVFRFPNSQASGEAENVFGEAWLKQNLVIARKGDTKLSLYGQYTYSRDTLPNDWNNFNKLALGAALSTRIANKLTLTLSAREEYYSEIHTDTELDAFRYGLSYYFADDWKSDQSLEKDAFGYLKTTVSAYGAMTFPASLEEGNTNITIIQGAELARQYQLPNSKFKLAPFLGLNVDWDKEQLSYNNKLKTSVGTKLIYPLSGGQMYAGAKYEAGYTPLTETMDTGPSIYFGWYKTWNQKF